MEGTGELFNLLDFTSAKQAAPVRTRKTYRRSKATSASASSKATQTGKLLTMPALFEVVEPQVAPQYSQQRPVQQLPAKRQPTGAAGMLRDDASLEADVSVGYQKNPHLQPARAAFNNTLEWVESLLSCASRWQPLFDELGKLCSGGAEGRELERLLRRQRQVLRASGHSLSDVRPTWTMLSGVCEEAAYGQCGIALGLLWSALSRTLDAPNPTPSSLGLTLLGLSRTLSDSFFSDQSLAGPFGQLFREELKGLGELSWPLLALHSWVSLQAGVCETLDARGVPSLGGSAFLLFAAAWAGLNQAADDGPDALETTLDLFEGLLEQVEESAYEAGEEQVRIWWRAETSMAQGQELLAKLGELGVCGAGVHYRDLFGYGPLQLTVSLPDTLTAQVVDVLSIADAQMVCVPSDFKGTLAAVTDQTVSQRLLRQQTCLWLGKRAVSEWVTLVVAANQQALSGGKRPLVLLADDEAALAQCRKLQATLCSQQVPANVLSTTNLLYVLVCSLADDEASARTLLRSVQCVPITGRTYKSVLKQRAQRNTAHQAWLLLPQNSDIELAGEVFAQLNRYFPQLTLEIVPAPSQKKPVLGLI